MEAYQAFEELKKYLSSMPLLSQPELSEELFLYLVVSPIAISAVLVWEEGKLQKLVYYINKVFHDAETRYTRMKKLIFVLIISARKIWPYFRPIASPFSLTNP